MAVTLPTMEVDTAMGGARPSGLSPGGAEGLCDARESSCGAPTTVGTCLHVSHRSPPRPGGMRGVVSYAPRSKLASSSSGGKDSTSIGAYWRSQKRPRRRSLRGEADDARRVNRSSRSRAACSSAASRSTMRRLRRSCANDILVYGRCFFRGKKDAPRPTPRWGVGGSVKGGSEGSERTDVVW